MKKYWYLYTYFECPVCSRGDVHKERQYTEKPEDPRDRHKYEECYDYCLEDYSY